MGRLTVDWGLLLEYLEAHPKASAAQVARDCGCSITTVKRARAGERGDEKYGSYDPQHMPAEWCEHCRMVRDRIGWLLFGFRRPEVQLDLFEDQG